MPLWRLANSRSLLLDRPRIMAILNVTPDSFSDGGRHATPEAALAAAARLVDEGADMLDIGGESTRPGAARVEAAEQVGRIVPVIRAIRSQPGPLGTIPISADTTREAVAQAALDAGADAVNDVSGGTEDPALLGAVARAGAGMVLMHRLAEPGRDSYSDRYAAAPIAGDVVALVIEEFRHRLLAGALRAGIGRERIVIDPGLGFGKTVAQNLELIRRSAEISRVLGFPLLSGLSRKSFVGRVSLGRDSTPAERLSGTLALSLGHLAAGASLFRVHDVAAHVQAFAAAGALIPTAGTRSPA